MEFNEYGVKYGILVCVYTVKAFRLYSLTLVFICLKYVVCLGWPLTFGFLFDFIPIYETPITYNAIPEILDCFKVIYLF